MRFEFFPNFLKQGVLYVIIFQLSILSPNIAFSGVGTSFLENLSSNFSQDYLDQFELFSSKRQAISADELRETLRETGAFFIRRKIPARIDTDSARAQEWRETNYAIFLYRPPSDQTGEDSPAEKVYIRSFTYDLKNRLTERTLTADPKIAADLESSTDADISGVELNVIRWLQTLQSFSQISKKRLDRFNSSSQEPEKSIKETFSSIFTRVLEFAIPSAYAGGLRQGDAVLIYGVLVLLAAYGPFYNIKSKRNAWLSLFWILFIVVGTPLILRWIPKSSPGSAVLNPVIDVFKPGYSEMVSGWERNPETGKWEKENWYWTGKGWLERVPEDDENWHRDTFAPGGWSRNIDPRYPPNKQPEFIYIPGQGWGSLDNYLQWKNELDETVSEITEKHVSSYPLEKPVEQADPIPETPPAISPSPKADEMDGLINIRMWEEATGFKYNSGS